MNKNSFLSFQALILLLMGGVALAQNPIISALTNGIGQYNSKVHSPLAVRLIIGSMLVGSFFSLLVSIWNQGYTFKKNVLGANGAIAVALFIVLVLGARVERFRPPSIGLEEFKYTALAAGSLLLSYFVSMCWMATKVVFTDPPPMHLSDGRTLTTDRGLDGPKEVG